MENSADDFGDWQQASGSPEPADAVPPAGREPAPSQPPWPAVIGATHGAAAAAPSPAAAEPRAILDVPPTWDGKAPELMVESYLKSLEGWMRTTRSMKQQRGLLVLQYAQADLKLVINELDLSELTAEDDGDKVLDHLREAYKHYIVQSLPRNFDAALYDKNCQRQHGESLLQYTTRKGPCSSN